MDCGERQVRMDEKNNHKEGRSGAKVMMKLGPAAGGSKAGNPTKSGGINRATNPTSQH